MSSYPSNADGGPPRSVDVNAGVKPTSTEKKRVIKPVVTDGVIQQKRPLGRRIKENLFSDDAGGVGKYVLMGVLLPAFKDMIVDAGQAALIRAVHGANAPGARTGGAIVAGSIANSVGQFGNFNYGTKSVWADPRKQVAAPETMGMNVQGINFQDIIINNRPAAEKIIQEMGELLQNYGSVTVGDLYDLIGVTTDDFPVENYGWRGLPGAGIQRVPNGYLLVLPRPERI